MPSRKFGNRLVLLTTMACLVFLLAYEFQDLVRFHAGLLRNHEVATRSDFGVYYSGVQRFLRQPTALYEAQTTRRLAGYTYPPLSIVLFVPFGLLGEAPAYVAFQCASIGALLLAIWLTLAMRRSGIGEARIDPTQAALFAMLVTASGAAFSNSVSGQANAIVIALCLGAAYLQLRQHPVVAGALLAFACWVKIYPALLVFVMLGNKSLRTTALMAMGFGLVLPVLFFWLVPLDLYMLYFFDLLPTMAGNVSSHVYNQSITASAVRLGLPPDQWLIWKNVDVATWIRALNAAVLVAMLAMFSLTSLRRAKDPLLVVLIVLAFIPLVAPLGWGHAYLFAMFLVAYCAVFGQSPRIRLLGGIAWLLMLVPAYSRLDFLRDVAPLLTGVLYFRYLIGAVIVIVVAIVWAAGSVRSAEGRALAG